MFWCSALNRSSAALPHQGKDPEWPATSSQSHPWFSSPPREHWWVKINLHFQHFRACTLFTAVHFREGFFWGMCGGVLFVFLFAERTLLSVGTLMDININIISRAVQWNYLRLIVLKLAWLISENCQWLADYGLNGTRIATKSCKKSSSDIF